MMRNRVPLSLAREAAESASETGSTSFADCATEGRL
jgi:hypothetical protein